LESGGQIRQYEATRAPSERRRRPEGQDDSNELEKKSDVVNSDTGRPRNRSRFNPTLQKTRAKEFVCTWSQPGKVKV
jgi:hypothetical protein